MNKNDYDTVNIIQASEMHIPDMAKCHIESFKLACKAEGYERLTLSVLKQNTHAAAFYKKHGWYRSGASGESIRFVLDL